MASRVWHIGTLVLSTFALTLGCLQAATNDGTTFGNTDLGTSGFDTFEAEGAEFEGGLEEGLLGDCGQYLDACLQDPYCFCFFECVVANFQAQAANPLAGCMEKCQLAAMPYWAEQFLVCTQGELELPEPDPDSGEEGRDTDSTTALTLGTNG